MNVRADVLVYAFARFPKCPRYTKTRCFEPFPFPDATDPQRDRIRFLGEQLDAHRKRHQELYPHLTLTQMYNVLEDLRSGEPLSAASQLTYDQGLISVLRDIHDDLDRAVAEAYGWPADLSREEILFRVVELNAARADKRRRMRAVTGCNEGNSLQTGAQKVPAHTFFYP